MRFKVPFFVTILSAIIMGSCASIGLNLYNKTPKKPSKLPEFTVKDSLMGYNSAFRTCFDVTFYDINLTFNIEEKSIHGFVITRFNLLNNTQCIQLDLDNQFIIDSIIQNHRLLNYKRKYTAIFIDLMSDNTQQQVAIYYHGKPKSARRPPWEGGFVWKKDKNKNPFVSVACEGEGAQTWLPIKIYLGDEPDSIATHFTVPKNLMAISNGNSTGVIESGNQKTYSWKTSYSINPYNITFYIGDYKLIENTYTCIDGEKMKLHYYVLTQNFEKAKTHFLQTDSILKVYELLFGKYPWAKDNFKLVESPFAGMEHQTAIAYGNGYKNEKDERYDHIILHEVAHEWWGNAVSVADFADVWIHEGIATYAEALYVEKTKGYKAYLEYISWTEVSVMNKKPVIGPKGLYYWNYKDGDVYSKGAVMLHTLRNHISNDTIFFKIIKTFFDDYCYKTATTEDFIKIANTISQKDLTVFFNQYLYKRESPLLKWNYEHDNNTNEDVLIYQFDRVPDDFTTPIEIKQNNDVFYITPKTKTQYIALPNPAYVPLYMNSKYSYIQDGYKKIHLNK